MASGHIARALRDTVAPVPAPANAAFFDEVIQLKTLLDAGVLAQEEFDAKKKQLLGL